MIKILIAMLSFMSVPRLCNQEVYKNLDLIIVIDENISVGTISNFKIKVTSDNSEVTISPVYYPGNLTIKQDDYLRMLSDTTKAIFFDFNYNEYVNSKQHTYHYKIEYKKSWLKELFNILRVYNLNKSKYKKEFGKVKTDQDYIFEMDSPDGTFRHIR